MTDDRGPQRPAPPSSPPSAPQGWSGGARHERPDDEPAPSLAPRERALIDEAVVPVGRRGRGPAIATSLVIAAFLVGLLRPWDLLAPPAMAGPKVTPGPRSPAAEASAGLAPTLAPAPAVSLTCAYPLTWRTATIESWNGRQARVWKATEVVRASGPDDPSIPFEPIVAETVTAIGWCAPVEGAERPPLASTATLYRVDEGVATPVAFDRLEPAAPDALGELLVPTPRGVGNRPPWRTGRYVIELRSASGGYVRYLGLDLSDHVVRASAAPARPSPTLSSP